MPTQTNKKCSVKNCYQGREEGDLLFCSNCRALWMELCRIRDMEFAEVPQPELNKVLKYFQEGLFNKDNKNQEFFEE